ncbi:MAG: EamA family transporter RarD [candidate division KSB1 bacterium]|nr:EamA family transporter RarD [candidate division KSB1 bacterium]
MKGTVYGIAAYTLWGLFPMYWKLLDQVSPIEILGHRIVWSFVLLLILLRLLKYTIIPPQFKQNPKTLRVSFLASVLLAGNWLTFIFAVTSGYIVEASLGYFINPLFSIILGMLFLHERPRSGQWFAIALAIAGVLYLTFMYGSFPWIALTLTFTFGVYGLLRKTMALNSLQGLFVETGLLSLPAVLLLLFLESKSILQFGQASLSTHLLLITAGVVTATPLLLFAGSARRVPLTHLGFLQYLAPTLQFLLGIFLYHEPFSQERLTGFSLIWLAILVYMLEGARSRQRRKQSADANCYE